jgi:hypothetical protein
VLTIRAATGHAAAIAAVDDLLAKQRIERLFVGNVARAAWLGSLVDSGSIDVLGLMQSQQKNNVAMMASHRGFVVDRDEVESTAELDLVPLTFDGVRVHVLVASNALYARMFGAAHAGRILSPSGEAEDGLRTRPTLRVPAAEDLALMLTMSEDEDAVRQLAAKPEFDRTLYNQKLISIGLAARVIPTLNEVKGRDPLLRREPLDSSPSVATRNDTE